MGGGALGGWHAASAATLRTAPASARRLLGGGGCPADRAAPYRRLTVPILSGGTTNRGATAARPWILLLGAGAAGGWRGSPDPDAVGAVGSPDCVPTTAHGQWMHVSSLQLSYW